MLQIYSLKKKVSVAGKFCLKDFLVQKKENGTLYIFTNSRLTLSVKFTKTSTYPNQSLHATDNVLSRCSSITGSEAAVVFGGLHSPLCNILSSAIVLLFVHLYFKQQWYRGRCDFWHFLT